jgi:hypothetical protein
MWVKSGLNWGKEWVNFALFRLCQVKTGIIVKSVCGRLERSQLGYISWQASWN